MIIEIGHTVLYYLFLSWSTEHRIVIFYSFRIIFVVQKLIEGVKSSETMSSGPGRKKNYWLLV